MNRPSTESTIIRNLEAELNSPHTITVLLAGAAVVATIPATHFDGLTRQRIIVAAEKATGGRVEIVDDEQGEPLVLVYDQQGNEVARGVLVVEPA